MKIKEVIIAEGILSSLAQAAFKNKGSGGYGYQSMGPSGDYAYKHFMQGFTKELTNLIQSSETSGMPVNFPAYINAYLTKYHWHASQQQQQILFNIGSQLQASSNPGISKQLINKLGAALWQVGHEQMRDPRTGKVININQTDNSQSNVSSNVMGNMANQLTATPAAPVPPTTPRQSLAQKMAARRGQA